jgi:hypothetical protein
VTFSVTPLALSNALTMARPVPLLPSANEWIVSNWACDGGLGQGRDVVAAHEGDQVLHRRGHRSGWGWTNSAVCGEFPRIQFWASRLHNRHNPHSGKSRAALAVARLFLARNR